MLNEVIEYLNNYFFKYTLGVKNYTYTKDVTFTATGTLAATDFSSTFVVGEYILIENTRLNDGIYLITAIDATTITVDATLDIAITSEAEVEATLTKLYIPKQLIALIADIKTYNTNTTDGVVSESQGNRSVTYGTSSGGGASGWQSAFKNRLERYKKLRW